MEIGRQINDALSRALPRETAGSKRRAGWNNHMVMIYVLAPPEDCSLNVGFRKICTCVQMRSPNHKRVPVVNKSHCLLRLLGRY